jgi:hypothetical protein
MAIAIMDAVGSDAQDLNRLKSDSEGSEWWEGAPL